LSPRPKPAIREPAPPQVTPTGTLVHLRLDQLKPNPSNPRRLFDPKPLASLKASIGAHGVLVPLTVYKLPGQDKYAIVDGERRYRCCAELAAQGVEKDLPANVVDPPDSIASLIYMFNIHQFREQWELMPTARALKTVIEELGHQDAEELHQITGLSEPQLERCFKILSFPERFQQLSLLEDPKKRVPSNFWVELYPVLGKATEVAPDLLADLGRDGITEQLVKKYQANKIKSVIHFRRILEAFDVAQSEDETREVAEVFKTYVREIERETRAAFDGFIRDPRRVQRATDAADQFMRDVSRAKIDHTVDGKDDLVRKFREVVDFTTRLIEKLEGGDAPKEKSGTGEAP
jgi:ParB family transcriptional regulator, chromosome partitioning protein